MRRLIPALILLLLIAGGAYYWYQEQQFYNLDSLLSRLPSADAAIAKIAFSDLRSAGALNWIAGTGAEEEPEYRNFVAKTGFDYKRDLDLALVSFHSSGVYFLVRGRFDWPKLEAYAKENGGSCYQGLCRMAGSTPERRISYFPLRRNLMAMAVSRDDFAATTLNETRGGGVGFVPPAQPVWLNLTPGALRDPERFPEGTRLIAKALEISENTTISLGAAAGDQFEARLEAQCRDERSARTLVETLQRITTLLTSLIRREDTKPGPADLASVLTSGEFRQDGRRATGRWLLSRAFLDKLAEPGK